MNDKIDFVCCDFLQANRLALHVAACVAEHAREMISERTLAGLAAAEEQGVKLGSLRARHQRNATGGRCSASAGHRADAS